MDLMYLKNGQACCLKEKIGEKYIVNKVYEQEQYFDEYYEMVECIDENDIIVDAVFKTPPIEKFSQEVIKLNDEISELKKNVQQLTLEKLKLSDEVLKLTKTKIESNKFVLNKTELINAKTLALFPKDGIMPKVFESKDRSFSGLKVSMSTIVGSTEEKYWGYKVYYDDVYSSGDFLCEKYGILINPTEEEIEETIKKRLSEFKFDNYKIANVDDKYLTQPQIEIKNAYLSNKKLQEEKILNKQLVEIQEKLKKLINGN